MTFEFPFVDDRLMGSVHRVDGASATISLPRARQLPRTLYGQRTGLGEVGEFVVIDIAGQGVLARLLELQSPDPTFTLQDRESSLEDSRNSGHAQLLCTVTRDGSYLRGVVRHPRIGDDVYSASDQLIRRVLEGINTSQGDSDGPMLRLGRLRAAQDVEVSLSAARLLGRHLAIVGATGGGKSWFLARVSEEVASAGGRLLLIDATGEFNTLSDAAAHWAISPGQPLEQQCQHAYLPHHEFNEADRFAFLRPAMGVQVPKLRSAIRSLRLVEALGSEHEIVSDGLLVKKGRLKRPFTDAEGPLESLVNSAHAPFDLAKSPGQIRQECVYDTDRNQGTHFGDWSTQDLAYCQSLLSRILDLLQTKHVVDVIAPTQAPISVLQAIDTWGG